MDPLQIESISFSNFKALVNTTLPLGRFTLIVGPNGSGKSTALQALIALQSNTSDSADFVRFLSAAHSGNGNASPKVTIQWNPRPKEPISFLHWSATARIALSTANTT